MDDLEPGGPEADAPDEATAAFEALRREVHELRRFAAAAVQQRPDYAPTLGAMAATLVKIEAHPALKLTPQAYAEQLRSAQEAAQRRGEQALASAAGRVEASAGALARTLDQARAVDRQNLRVLQATLAGIAFGAVLWVVLSGPLVRALPVSWHAPEKMAAAVMDEDRATAGQHMIASVNPQAWAESLAAIRLYRANREALAVCGRKAQSSGATVRCTISVAFGS